MPIPLTEPKAKADPEEWRENRSYPKVIPRIERGRENWALHIDQCPRCGGKTLHGGGPVTELPYGGYRSAHCCRVTLNIIIPQEWGKEPKK